MIKLCAKQKGSALIIALLIMGVLITLALGLSDLVIREVRITSDIINAGKAFYFAEAGVESALLDLHQTLPGYQREDAMIDGELVIKGNTFDINEDIDYTYRIENQTNSIPFIDTKIIDKEIAEGKPKQYMYNVLELNESVTIPLFIQKEDATIQNIKDFRVEYFIDAKISPEWTDEIGNNVIDMLRWKITGINSSSKQGTVCSKYYDPFPNSLTTESVGDYVPANINQKGEMPSCLGTTEAKFTDPTNGIEYKNDCANFWPWAREAFVFAPGPDGVPETIKYTVDDANPVRIEEFLDCHDTNYLTLSNIFNPSILLGLSDFTKRNNAKIYYRFLVPNEDEKAVREFAKITSVGTFNKSRKQIEAFIKPDSFMPVFNFSLYRTQVGGSGDKQNPQGYLETSGE
ncbi:hypothetical protein ACFLZH_01840 [Patescibacteria group bacterium]